MVTTEIETGQQATPATFPDGRTRWPRGRRKMSLGLMVPVSERHMFGATPRFQDMLEITRVADQVGFDVAWYADHLIVGEDNPAEGTGPFGDVRGVWECWTMLGGIAAATERIHLGSLVACTGFRNAALLAKMAESVDEISDGRLILGLGAGWHKPEYEMFGYPYDHRASRFEEAISVIHPLLRGETVTFHGSYERVSHAVNRPVGPRPGDIPILIGTDGPRMLRLTARYADAWNTVWHNDAAVTVPLNAAVDEACRDVGRDPETLVRTAGGNIALTNATGKRPNPMEGSPAAIAESIQAFADLGFIHFVCGIDPCTPQSIEEFARVIEILDRA